jgi:formamidopyrimidine-DNA glycosylase
VPEGHSVHRLARQFRDVFGGARLRVSSPQGRFAAGAALIDGARLAAAEAHGKQLFLAFDNHRVLRVHLGLYGAWDFGGDATFRGASSIGAPRRIGEREAYDDAAPAGPEGAPGDGYGGPPEPVGQVRVRLVSEHGWADLRGPTACEVLTPQESATARGRLGPDPLDRARLDEGRAEFIRRVARRTVLATLLMDQSVLAGVGNIYRAETLFRARLDPWLPGRDLGPVRAAALWDDVAATMADGVREGRIVTTRAEHRAGVVPVWPDGAHYVYQRSGLPCRVCGTPVALTALGGRKLYWCPACQAGTA